MSPPRAPAAHDAGPAGTGETARRSARWSAFAPEPPQQEEFPAAPYAELLLAIDPARFDPREIERNPFFCPDPQAAIRWEALVDDARKSGSSLGAVIECECSGVPAGWGAPLYAKLDSELAAAMMSINAVKGVEIGDGFAAARLTGEQNADPMRPATDGSNRPDFLSNNAGGIAGGISTGQPVVLRVAFKPTSSILTPVPTINKAGEATDIVTRGRHDPCVGIRGAPVVEAMMALVLADHKLLNRAQNG